MGTEHKCQWCGKEFEPTCHKSRQKFRSAECRIKYHRYYGGKVDVCPECGAPVEQSGERGRWRRFCRDECRKEWWKEYRKANPSGEPGMHKCAFCGKEFTSERWHGGEYCSRECYLQAMAQTREDRVCGWCGEGFSTFVKSEQKYCCRECAAAARHDPGHKRGMRRIRYTNAEDWKEQLHEASKKSPPPKTGGKGMAGVRGNQHVYGAGRAAGDHPVSTEPQPL